MKTLLLLVFTVAGFAQTAKVIELKAEDRIALEDVYKAKAAAEKELDRVQAQIIRLYLVVDEDSPDKGNLTWSDPSSSISAYAWSATIGGTQLHGPCNQSWESAACLEVRLNQAREKEAAGQRPEPRVKSRYYRDGWTNGFEPSKDFKFIVPKPEIGMKSSYYPWTVTN